MSQTTVRGVDVSRVDHLEARLVLKRHFDDAPETDLPEDEAKRLAALQAERSRIERVLEDQYRAMRNVQLGSIEAQIKLLEDKESALSEARWDATDAALDGLGVEFEDFKLHDDYCGVDRCEVTDLPLLRDDALLETPTCGSVLAAILPVPTDAPKP